MNAKEEMLYWIEKEHPALVERMRLEEYEETHGEHYNEEYAKRDVERMYHHEDGKLVEGEIFPIERVKVLTEQYSSMFDKEDTCWDKYVALNAYAHDLGANYHKHAPNNGESWLVEDAMKFWFGDEDAPYGKIWRYERTLDC